MDFEGRIERLETQNRRLRAGALSVLLVAGALMVTGARRGDVAEVLQARQFQVVDASGSVVAVLGAKDGQGHLSLLDGAGNWKVQLHALTPGGMVTLKSSAGQPLVSLGFDDRGNGSVRTNAANGKQLVSLSAAESGRGAVTTYAPDGGEVVTLSTTPSGAGAVTTFDGQGRRLVGVTVTTQGKGAVAAFNPDGSVRASWP